MDRRSFVKGLGAAALTASAYSRVLGANDRVRLAIIGPGARGQQLMKDAIKAPQTEFVAVADAFTLRQQQALAIAPTAKAYSDYREMLARNDIDAVFVATPLHLHCEHALATIAAGKDLYCEKTMAYCIDEARKIRDAARSSKQVVGVGLQHVSSAAFYDVKEFLTPGNMGKITRVRAWMGRNTPHGQAQWYRKPPAQLTPENVRWDLFLGLEDHHNRRKIEAKFDAHRYYNWRFFWIFSGGNVTENMTHQISFWTKAMDLPVPSAATMTGGVYLWKDGREVPDTIDVTLEYADMNFSWTSSFGNSHEPFGEEVQGTDGTIVRGRRGSNAEYYPENVNRKDAAEQTGTSKSVGHVANFIECVRTRKEPNAPAELGYRTAVACHMANRAYRTQSRVKWDAAKEQFA